MSEENNAILQEMEKRLTRRIIPGLIVRGLTSYETCGSSLLLSTAAGELHVLRIGLIN